MSVIDGVVKNLKIKSSLPQTSTARVFTVTSAVFYLPHKHPYRRLKVADHAINRRLHRGQPNAVTSLEHRISLPERHRLPLLGLLANRRRHLEVEPILEVQILGQVGPMETG